MCVKNIIIKDFSLYTCAEMEKLIPESIISNSRCIKFISNNTNIRLFRDKETIEKLVSCGCSYLVMKIMLNNDGSIDNINKQLLLASEFGYLSVVKLLIDLGADIHAYNDGAIIWASRRGPADLRVISTFCRYYREHYSVVKLLIELGANINTLDGNAINWAFYNSHLSVVELLAKNGANIRGHHLASYINKKKLIL